MRRPQKTIPRAAKERDAADDTLEKIGWFKREIPKRREELFGRIPNSEFEDA